MKPKKKKAAAKKKPAKKSLKKTTAKKDPSRKPAKPVRAAGSSELAPQYDPKLVEKKWYAEWLNSGAFKAAANPKKKPYAIVIPPPNVTGILHMGHALNNTLQDILVRAKRMQGYETLWMPGTDHAGIATQNVVERALKKEENKSRYDIGREAFIERVWKWREKYGSTIIHQLKRLGASCDFSRTRFTMDEGLSKAVREVFVRLYEKDLIYRSNYIINWCPRCQTALSDEEAQHKDMQGHLYYLKYAIKDSGDTVTIATTRPETMLGDTAVGFNPSDARYQHLKGRTAILPILNRELRLIEDESIDPQFGTGALKITPAHDPVDFELSRKHHLPSVNILNPNGTLNDQAGPYKGLDRFEARRQIIHDLQERGILLETKDHTHAVGHCYRCQTVVEPYLSLQWFVRMKPLAEPALKAVLDKKTTFTPARWTKVYQEWMENIRDWCISRQIWWGHRIPVWYCSECPPPGIIVSRETPKQCPKCGSKNLRQDEDVLDTWFSSWLWPFSTLGWPEKNKDLSFFYPTSCLVTGYEIIFFWVARMMMAGIEFMGDVPFRSVYIHGIVRDEHGAKMSKSLGNAVDPIQIIDKYGADALRFAIISITAEGQDVYCSEEKFEMGRNFANKLWNAARLLAMNRKTSRSTSRTPLLQRPAPDRKTLSGADRWILSRLNQTIASVTDSIERLRFNEAMSTLYDFFWHQYCDWYLELAKPSMDKPQTLWTAHVVLEQFLRLLHPVMPFITEEIRHSLPGARGSILRAEWPMADSKWIDAKIEEEMGLVLSEIQAIRNVRSAWQINPKDPVTVVAKTASDKEQAILREHADYVVRLARVSSFQIGPNLTRPKGSAVANVGRVETWVVLAGLVDLDLERKRIRTALDETEKAMRGLQGRLANQEFLKKAPADVVAKERERAVEFENRKKKLEENLLALGD